MTRWASSTPSGGAPGAHHASAVPLGVGWSWGLGLFILGGGGGEEGLAACNRGWVGWRAGSCAIRCAARSHQHPLTSPCPCPALACSLTTTYSSTSSSPLHKYAVALAGATTPGRTSSQPPCTGVQRVPRLCQGRMAARGASRRGPTSWPVAQSTLFRSAAHPCEGLCCCGWTSAVACVGPSGDCCGAAMFVLHMKF